MNLSCQTLTEHELPIVDSILRAAYRRDQSYTERLRQHLVLEPEGWKVVQADGAIIGCGGSTVMGTAAYIGLVGIEPSFQRRGVASFLMDHLLDWSHTRGCTTILLDASTAGEPLYRRLGFVVEDSVGVWTASPSRLPEMPVRYTGILQAASISDLAAMIDADTHWTNMPRQRIIQALACDQPLDHVLVARKPAGDLEGYLVVQPKVIGPWLATSAAAAGALLYQGLPLVSDPTGVTIFAPSSNLAATDILLRYGFARLRSLAHMRLGIPLDADRRQRIYGQMSLALG
jgi:GNAT superfamily N-acetyltransferase